MIDGDLQGSPRKTVQIAHVRMFTQWPNMPDSMVWFPRTPSALPGLNLRRYERGSNLYIALADGSDNSELLLDSPDRGLHSPDWSPNGQVVAYTEYWGRSPNDRYRLMAVPVTGGTPTVIIPESSTPIRYPTWSEDGQRIVYYSDPGIMLVEDLPVVTGVPSTEATPAILFHGNHPNPFNASTVIEFETTAPGRVTVNIYSLNGRKIATLRDGVLAAGPHMVSWRGTDGVGKSMSSGVYLYRIITNDMTVTGRMTLVK